MTICLSIMTACTAHQKGKQVVGGVGIAFLYLFLVVFAFAWVRKCLSCIQRSETNSPPMTDPDAISLP